MAHHRDVAATMERHQVAIYLGAIVVGTVIGLAAPGTTSGLDVAINPAIAVLLYVTFLQVPVRSLTEALRDTRFMAAVLTVNFVAVPLLVAVMFPLLPNDDAIRIGVLLVLLCPCVDYVIVFSRLAGADHRRLLAATPILLIAQMALLPVYLSVFVGGDLAAVVDVGPFVTAFVVLIAIPLASAWLTQWAADRLPRVQRVRTGADLTMVPLMVIVLVVVTASQIHTLDGYVRDVAAVVPVYGAFLVVMPIVGVSVARLLRLGPAQRRAVAFSGATRNSLVVLPLALSLPAAYDLAGSVVITQTLVEIVGMVVLVAVFRRVGRSRP
ncbi:bile acid:sodium symporter [Gordonia sp. CPCC 206044]|uniref:arsenic resistance protein n=1 Tax=Gordonia sp. CPCC 206044 TaxID=3140793 RepID=UPI003AF3B149